MVDWDKIEADLKKEEDAEQLEGDDGTQKLFRTIYAGATSCALAASCPDAVRPSRCRRRPGMWGARSGSTGICPALASWHTARQLLSRSIEAAALVLCCMGHPRVEVWAPFGAGRCGRRHAARHEQVVPGVQRHGAVHQLVRHWCQKDGGELRLGPLLSAKTLTKP